MEYDARAFRCSVYMYGLRPVPSTDAKMLLRFKYAAVMMTSTRCAIYRPGRRTSFALLVALTVIFAFLRGLAMLGPPGARWMLPFSFCVMALLPWILMTREGRTRSGLRRPTSPKHYLPALAAGAALAFACFLAGITLFGVTEDNWFLSVARNYRSILDTSGFTTIRLHLTFTLPALIFSPVGEEIFFRGMLQQALEQYLNVRISTILECAAFGLIHLFHHGLLRTESGFTFLPVSGSIWVLSMFLVAVIFAGIRKSSVSIYPAIAAHAAFNLVMNLTIFTWLWDYTA